MSSKNKFEVTRPGTKCGPALGRCTLPPTRISVSTRSPASHTPTSSFQNSATTRSYSQRTLSSHSPHHQILKIIPSKHPPTYSHTSPLIFFLHFPRSTSTSTQPPSIFLHFPDTQTTQPAIHFHAFSLTDIHLKSFPLHFIHFHICSLIFEHLPACH